MKKTLLLNWVYYRPVGHVVEAMKLTKGYALANPDLEIHLLLNSEAPQELADVCPWIAKTYPISTKPWWRGGSRGKTIRAIPKEWDYIITDDRASRFADWDEQHLIKTQETLSRVLKARVKKGYTEQADAPRVLPCEPNPKVELAIPDTAIQFAERYRHDGPAICIMLGGSAGDRQSPSVEMWGKICKALVDTIPGLKIYFTGVTKEENGRTSTLDFSLDDITKLAQSLPNAEVAYNIGLWNQLALIKKCNIFLSPHTGFAFLAPLVNTPWLELANCRWPAYVFNDIPFYSVLPECGSYPALGDHDKGCGKLLGDNQKALCMTDALLKKKIPEIVHGAQLLLDTNYSYEQAIREHIDKINTYYDRSRFFFFGGIDVVLHNS